MNAIFQMDRLKRPDLFRWNGAIAKTRLNDWLFRHAFAVPADLFSFWEETGGGDLFESETILGPFGEARWGDDLESTNDVHHRRGLDRRYLVVHVGSSMTAVRLDDQKWVTLDPDTYVEMAEYNSFDGWYVGALRAEFADRYGLVRA